MTSVVFVHGTGVRAARLEATISQIERALSAHNGEVEVLGCRWGDDVGSRLYGAGASIPVSDSGRDFASAEPDDHEVLLWSHLYEDPTYELKLLALAVANTAPSSFHPIRGGAGAQIVAYFATVVFSSQSIEAADEGGLAAAEIENARTTVLESRILREAVRCSSIDPSAFWHPIARCVVALAIQNAILCGKEIAAMYDADVRDRLALSLTQDFAGAYRSIGGRLGRLLASSLIAGPATRSFERRRQSLIQASYPLPGDVLLYQRDGRAIRQHVADCLDKSRKSTVLLAHSLGGVIALDLLVAQPLPVELLVTVGTAAPFFYELNALWSIRAGDPLPAHFPRWLNIYDRRDFLSFVASGLFGVAVTDVEVDNRQPFPRSHSAYWWNPATWKAISARLP